MVVTKTYKKIKCTNSFYIDVMKSNNMIENIMVGFGGQ